MVPGFDFVDSAAQSPLRQAKIRGLDQSREREALESAKAGMKAESIAKRKAQAEIVKAQAAAGFRGTGQGFRGALVGGASAAGMSRVQPDFSSEQRMLGKMFGQGEKIWGINNEPVVLHNDLNPSRSDPYDETAGMFGFGSDGERSGLF